MLCGRYDACIHKLWGLHRLGEFNAGIESGDAQKWLMKQSAKSTPLGVPVALLLNCCVGGLGWWQRLVTTIDTSIRGHMKLNVSWDLLYLGSSAILSKRSNVYQKMVRFMCRCFGTVADKCQLLLRPLLYRLSLAIIGAWVEKDF